MALQQDFKKETNFPSAFENQRNTTYEKKYSDLNAIGLCQLLPGAYLKIVRGGGGQTLDFGRFIIVYRLFSGYVLYLK